MCVGTYVRTYMCVCVCVCVCTHYVCMYVYMYVCMYVCMHVCMHVCMQVCMYACMCVCMYFLYIYTLFTLRAPLLWSNTTCLDITLLSILWLHVIVYWYSYLLAYCLYILHRMSLIFIQYYIVRKSFKIIIEL